MSCPEWCQARDRTPGHEHTATLAAAGGLRVEYYQRHHGPVPVVRLWLDGDLITAKCHDRPDALRDIAAALTEAAGLLDIINEQEGNS